MDVTLTYYGRVKDGTIELPGKRFRQEVARAFEGKPIEVVVRRRKKIRSPEQNRYYWGLVLNILAAQFRLWAPDQEINCEIAHEWCKDRFLPMIQDWDDITVTTPEGAWESRRTTTRLTTTQFMDYIALIQQWAAEYGLYIPDPDEWEFESVEAVNIDNR